MNVLIKLCMSIKRCLKMFLFFLTFKVLGRKSKCIAVQWRGMTLPISLWLPDSLSLSLSKCKKHFLCKQESYYHFPQKLKFSNQKNSRNRKGFFKVSFIFKTLLQMGSIRLLKYDVNVKKEKPGKRSKHILITTP